MYEQTPDVGAATERKALAINLDRTAYGAFAEIGAGQEVVRHFFKAGGASGTVAKSMSAYDMRVSDAIYGHPKRYVSRERLEQMLQHEYQLLVDRLAAERGAQTRFFAFADTVATTPHDGKGQGHSWIGLRFQEAPLTPPSEVLLHLLLWDKDAGRQQVRPEGDPPFPGRGEEVVHAPDHTSGPRTTGVLIRVRCGETKGASHQNWAIC